MRREEEGREEKGVPKRKLRIFAGGIITDSEVVLDLAQHVQEVLMLSLAGLQ